MRPWVFVLVALVGLGSARLARTAATRIAPPDATDVPYAPSPAAAPIVSLGYRELGADLLWVRLLGYWGGRDSVADAVSDLVDAIVELDPRFQRVYVSGVHAMTIADHGVTQDTFKHALKVLDKGMKQFPDDYSMPELAAEIYTGDLKTTDAAERRKWDEEGTRLMEAAIRKPGAPTWAATWAAYMRSKLGQKQRAIANLKEMILLTRDVEARKKMIDKLAEMESSDSAELASELYAEKHAFDAKWKRDRPTLPPNLYILLGPRLQPGFDMTDLATGGHDLVGSHEEPAKLPPVE